MERRWIGFLFLCLAMMLSSFSVENLGGRVSEIRMESQNGMAGVIAYVGSDGEIYLYIAETDSHIQLTEDAEWYNYRDVQFSPGFDSLAYLKSNPSARGYVFDLYIMDLIDLESNRVLENIGNYDWHPSGDRIAFGYQVSDNCLSPDQESTNGIMELNLVDGFVSELIPPFAANIPVGMPEYSYDGKWIKFSSYPCFSSGYATNIQNIVTGETSYFGDVSLNWASINNNHFLWVEYAFGDMQSVIFEYNPETDQTAEVYANPDYAIGGAYKLPGEGSIVFSLSTKVDDYFFDLNDYPNWEDYLMILNVNENSPKVICQSQEVNGCTFEAWSPDGQQILYTYLVDGKPKWALYSLSSQSVTELYNGFGDGGVQWQWDHGRIQWIEAMVKNDLATEQTTDPVVTETKPELTTTDVSYEPENRIMSQQNQSGPLKGSNITLFLILSGGCLVGVSVLIVIIVITLVKRKR